MNKKIKLLAPVLCGAILSSSLALTSVQAKTVQNKANSNVSVNSIITSQKYTCCGKISSEAFSALMKYFRNSSNYSVTDVRNILIQQGMNRSLASNVAYSIYDLQMQTKDFTIGLYRLSYGAEILQAEDGTYTLMVIDSSDEPVENYSFYGLLQSKDITLLRDFFHSDVDHGVNSLTQYLIEKNIVSDSTVANKLAWGLYLDFNEIDKFAALNENVLVLKSDDGNYYRIAPQAR